MSEILKKPYKITLWEDKNIYVVNKEKKSQLENGDEVQNQYLEEVCVATIGSNTMDTPIRVFNPILTEELNGSRTLTFQIYYRYWDDDSEDFKLNPFINLLVNERKVKLKYNDEWYDFVIKQVQEDSESKVFTYTCSDLFINELGKTGYEVELDTELQNNMGTIQELTATILEGTDWSEKNSDHLIQRNKELLYSYILPNAIQATDMKSNETTTISAGEVIYVFYSCKVRNEMPVQFLYVPSNGESTYDEALLRYKIDKDGFITNSKNWQTSNSINYNNLRHSSYFGEKIVEKQKSKFIPEIGETCTVWSKNNQQYYCYTELEYASVAEIQNMLVNGANFITVNGWSGNVTLSTYTNNSTTYRTISVTGTVKNNGFFANRAALAPKGFVKDSSYTFVVKAGGSNNISSAQVKVKDNGGTETTILNFSSGTMVNSGVLSGYKKFTATCNTSINYQSLVNDYLDIIFVLTSNSSTKIIDAKAFLNRYDSNGDLIVPDLQATANSIVKTRYNFFPVNTNFNIVYGKDSLTLTETLENTAGYTPVMIEGYGKVTSITGSKSNRFNLIQSLCEAFECWAKFSIEHNENTGKILYDYIPLAQDEYVEGGRYYTYIGNGNNPQESSVDIDFQIYSGNTYRSGLYKKVYHKYVTFKEFIGQDNIVGFRYGINLKSIQRDVVSDQIASKVIVQANTNEFAPNGSCTIQQAVLNPTGENALYNFQYFINHGLLDATALYDDLYGENGGLGFYPNMRALNDSITEPIQELALLSNTIITLESRQTVYNALLEEADNLKANISAELNANGYGISGGSNVPDYINNLRKNYESYDTTAGYYTSVSASNNSLLNSYRSQYEALSTQLKEVLAKKNKLNSDFHNKYYKFIQEGTWTSNDYYDPELYYQAANMVLYTSSFPQTSYTINVLELSQLEGYEPYTFKIADKTYIEDTEFFGYDYKNRPYKEEIVVSEVKYSLDDPTQNTITVQNYKTQFQDLFQRIAAASQSLQYNEGAYNRAANAITSNGEIQPALLQNSLKDNELIIQNAKNQSVTWDETGITISNFVNANELVRLTSGGIVLSVDGGQTWTTGITGTGINADVITTGRLDTSRIRIFNSQGNQTFEWNEKGINAFAWDTTSGHVDYSKLVRFDQYGLYGYIGDVGWDPTTAVDGDNVVGVNKVIRDSIFSLTWKGLSINIPTGLQNTPVITVGSKENPTFQVNADGSVILAGSITWSSNNSPMKVLYARTNLGKPVDSSSSTWNNYDDTDAENARWHKIFNSNDRYASYSYDGGATWTNVAVIVGEDGVTVKVLYNVDGESKPTDGTWENVPNTDDDDPSTSPQWHKTFDSANDKYVSYSYDNGLHWTEAIKFVAEDGYQGADGAPGQNAPTIKTLYSATEEPTPTSSDWSAATDSGTTWHKVFASATDIYASYSADDGQTWTAPVKIVGTDGQDGQDGQDGAPGQNAPEMRALYAKVNNINLPGDISGSWDSYYTVDDNNNPRWHKTFEPNSDKYAIYSYDGGKTWTAAVNIVGNSVKAAYAKGPLTTAPGAWDSLPNNDNGSSQGIWHKVFDSANDAYARYTYDNGSTWTDNVRLVGQNVDAETIFNILTNDSELFGLFNSDDGGLYINATYIKTGTLSANRISGGTLSGVELNIADGKLVANSSGVTVKGSIYANNLYLRRGGQYQNVLTVIDSTASNYTEALNMSYASGNFGGVFSGTINADTLVLKTGANLDAGYIKMTSASSAGYAVELHSGAALRLTAKSGSIYIATNFENSANSIPGKTTYFLQLNDDGTVNTNFTGFGGGGTATAVFG